EDGVHIVVGRDRTQLIHVSDNIGMDAALLDQVAASAPFVALILGEQVLVAIVLDLVENLVDGAGVVARQFGGGYGLTARRMKALADRIVFADRERFVPAEWTGAL